MGGGGGGGFKRAVLCEFGMKALWRVMFKVPLSRLPRQTREKKVLRARVERRVGTGILSWGPPPPAHVGREKGL